MHLITLAFNANMTLGNDWQKMESNCMYPIVQNSYINAVIVVEGYSWDKVKDKQRKVS